MRSLCIILFIFILNATASGQNHRGFHWIGPDHYLYSIDLKSGSLSAESPDKRFITHGVIVGWDSLSRDLPGDFDVNAFYWKDSVVLSIPGTGQVYQLKLADRVLKRLDQTYFRGYNFDAHQFIRKDTLFSIGGSGFWQKHSLITAYNPRTFEWERYPLNNTNPDPVDKRISGYSAENDAFFSVFFDVDPTYKGENLRFWVFSFAEKAWSLKGRVVSTLADALQRPYRTAWSGQYLFIFSGSGQDKVDIIEPFKNIHYRHSSRDDHFFLSNCDVYHQNGFLYSRSRISLGKNEKLILDSIPVDSLIKRSAVIGKVYSPDRSASDLIWPGAMLGVLFLVFAYRARRRPKPRKASIPLAEAESLVVSQFIQHPGKRFTTLEINQLLQIDKKSYDNQRQIRNRMISSINQQMAAWLNGKELILRAPNLEDKRMMDYFINPELSPEHLTDFQSRK